MRKLRFTAALALALCAVTGAALATKLPIKDLDDGLREFRINARIRLDGVIAALFELLPTSGAGAGTIGDACTYAEDNGLLSGDYFCLRGDGTEVVSTGYETTVSTGADAPLPLTQAVCSNGLDCSQLSFQRFSTSTVVRSTGTGKPSPVPPFSMCTVFRYGAGGSAQGPLFMFAADPADDTKKVMLYTYSSPDAVTPWWGGSYGNHVLLTEGAWNTLCLVVATSGDNKLYLNEDAAVTSTNAMPAAATGVFRFMGADTNHDLHAAMVTHKALTADEVKAFHRAALGTTTGTLGEAVTVSRNSARTCVASGGTLTKVPANRPCVTGGGFDARSAHANSALRSEEADDSAWTKYNATATANADIAKDGTKTADRLVLNTAADAVMEQQISDSAMGSKTHTVSAWVKSNTGSNQTFRFKLTHAGVADHLSSDLTATTEWQRLSFSQAFGAGGTGAWVGIYSNTAGGGADLLVWGLQVNKDSATALSYCPTEGSAVTCAADSISSTTITLNDVASLAATVKQDTLQAGYLLQARVSGTDFIALHAESSGHIRLTHQASGRSQLSTTAIAAGVASRVSGAILSDGTLRVCVDNVCDNSAPSALTFSGAYTVWVGSNAGTASHANGTIGAICVDPNPERCR